MKKRRNSSFSRFRFIFVVSNLHITVCIIRQFVSFEARSERVSYLPTVCVEKRDLIVSCGENEMIGARMPNHLKAAFRRCERLNRRRGNWKGEEEQKRLWIEEVATERRKGKSQKIREKKREKCFWGCEKCNRGWRKCNEKRILVRDMESTKRQLQGEKERVRSTWEKRVIFTSECSFPHLTS